MSETLYYWNRFWQSIAYDTEIGTGRVRWFSRRPKRCAGFAYYSHGHWYAIRLDGDDLIFQSRRDKWSMSGDFRCKNISRDTTRTFTIYKGDDTALKIQYEVSKGILEDPTADTLDVENTDFFYWVARVWNNPTLQTSLRAGWGKKR
jgi:hypothetical protein